MNIQTYIGYELAPQAHGTTIVVDVMRAATVAACLLNQGASSIIPVRTASEAMALKEKNDSLILVGEEGDPIPGFDYNNSPTQIAGVDFTGRTIVHRTTCGTQGLKLATNSEVVIFGSFVILDTLVKFINATRPAQLSILCTSNHADDLLFAEALTANLNGSSYDFAQAFADLRRHPDLRRFFDNNPSYPEADFWYCLKTSTIQLTPFLKDGVLVAEYT